MLKILLGFTVGGVAVWTIPHLLGDDDSRLPPITMLLVTALVVGFATTLALYLVVTRKLGLGRTIAALAVGYNLLLVLVKFVLAPRGFYEINQTQDLEQLMPMDTGIGAAATAAIVLLVYAAVYSLIFLVLRSRVQVPKQFRATPRRANAVLIVVLSVVAVGAGSGMAMAGYLALMNGVEYLAFVFGSSMSLLIVATVAVASVLATSMFAEAADRARAVGSAATMVSLFWVGLAFIALYHVLWVVFILVLTSIWPLKVVTPK